MGVIYKITSPSDRLYVGKTYNLKHRIAYYKHSIHKKKYDTILYNSFFKYGWDNHKFEIIEEVSDSLLNEREIFWIKELNTYHFENKRGMNMTRGGDGQRTTWMHKIEQRRKQSKKFAGEGNPFFGKHHTEENKKSQSQRAKAYALKTGKTIPKWGADKGRLNVIKAVVCYDSKGNFIKEFESTTDAANEFSVHRSSVSECCNLKITSVIGKYVFRYKTENYPPTISVGKIEVKDVKRPVLFLNQEFEVMCEYPSATEASAELEVPITSIRRAALYNYLWPIRTGHVFIYKDIYESLNLDN